MLCAATPHWEVSRAGFLSCVSAFFAQVLRRRIAEICGDSDLCLKTTHEFCGDLRRTDIFQTSAKHTSIASRFSACEITHLNVRRTRPPGARRSGRCGSRGCLAASSRSSARATSRPSVGQSFVQRVGCDFQFRKSCAPNI